VPAGLVVLSIIPILAGAARLNELVGGAEITAKNARFFASPIPVVVHIVSVSVYSVLGALQFVPSLRRARRSWHRIAGRILVPAGVLAALSGLWMTVFYPRPVGIARSFWSCGSSSARQCWRVSCWLSLRYGDGTFLATASTEPTNAPTGATPVHGDKSY
jgi:Predicted membrane protein (DUF2306)